MTTRVSLGGAAAFLMAAVAASAQVTGSFESHVAAAKAAAGTEHGALFTRICTQVEEDRKSTRLNSSH